MMMAIASAFLLSGAVSLDNGLGLTPQMGYSSVCAAPAPAFMDMCGYVWR